MAAFSACTCLMVALTAAGSPAVVSIHNSGRSKARLIGPADSAFAGAEAAMVVGASRLKTLLTITFPLAFPAIVASSLYAFLAAWNDSITALIMTNENPTLALLVYRTVGSSTIPNLPAAGAVVLLIPSLIFTFIIKDYINQLWGSAAI